MTYGRLQASRWRALAEESFARADRVRDADIRDKICRIAAGYERLAQRVEDLSAEGQCGAAQGGRGRLRTVSAARFLGWW
jgi:hypothetical protein